MVFFIPLHVIFLYISPHAAFKAHASECTVTSPKTRTLAVILMVTHESCPGSLQFMVTLGLPHIVAGLPMPTKALWRLLGLLKLVVH